MRRSALLVIPALLAILPGPVAAQRSPFLAEIVRVPLEHPDARPGVTAERVRPAAQYDHNPGVARAYLIAVLIPQVLDGIRPVCNEGRSFLSCFESDAAARCRFCIRVAHSVYRLHQEGKSLEQIRSALDSGVLD